MSTTKGTFVLDASRLVHAVTLSVASLCRPACVPSACYLALLFVSLHRPTVFGLVNGCASALVAAVSLALSISLPPTPLLPAQWWPDILALVSSVVSAGLSARSLWIARRNPPLLAQSSLDPAATTLTPAERAAADSVTCGLSGASISILAVALLLHPCLVAIPLVVAVLGALLAWGCGMATGTLSRSLRVMAHGARLYAAAWLVAAYLVQLALNVGELDAPALQTLGLVRLRWLVSSTPPPSSSSLHCSTIAE